MSIKNTEWVELTITLYPQDISCIKNAVCQVGVDNSGILAHILALAEDKQTQGAAQTYVNDRKESK